MKHERPKMIDVQQLTALWCHREYTIAIPSTQELYHAPIMHALLPLAVIGAVFGPRESMGARMLVYPITSVSYYSASTAVSDS